MTGGSIGRPLPHRLALLSLALTLVGCATSNGTVSDPSDTPGARRSALAIRVTARQYAWTFEYPGGGVSEELHVPVDCKVTLTLTSRDVVHALWIAAFDLREDALPGYESRSSFQARRTGSFDAFCAEYCGSGHPKCRAKVTVHEPDGFEQWIATISRK